MKKVLLLGLAIFSLFVYSLELRADCSIKKEDASKITVSTEKSVQEVHVPDVNNEGYDEDYEIVKVYAVVSNLKEGMSVLVTNDYNNKEETLNYSDSDNGVLKIESPSIYMRVNIKVKVYASSGECNELLREESIKTESYNSYTNSELCTENKDLKVCDPFYDANSKTPEEFKQLIKEEREDVIEANKTTGDKLVESLGKYWIFILIPILIIVIIFVIRIVIFNRGKSNE